MTDYDIAQQIDRMMRRIHVGLTDRSEQFDTARVGPIGGMILLALSDIEPAPIHVLAQQIARDKSQMTRMLKSLEEKGLIDRRVANEDARVVVLRLTPQGHLVVHMLRDGIAGVVGDVLAPLTQEERETLRALLVKAL